jgi:uncharacterized protein (DUF433 family)
MIWQKEIALSNLKVLRGNAISLDKIEDSKQVYSKITMDYRDIITIEPGKRSGKPCIRGMRITVYDVLSYLAAGMTYEEILEDFPYLTMEDILACLSYAAEREQQTLIVTK